MPTTTKQPQIQSKNFVSRYPHDGGLVLDVYGTFDGDGDFQLEAVGLAGTTTDISNLISEDLSATIVGWCEFMAPTWAAESRDDYRIEYYRYGREMAVAY